MNDTTMPPELRAALMSALGDPETDTQNGPKNMTTEERVASLRSSLEKMNEEHEFTPGMIVRRKAGLADGFKGCDAMIFIRDLNSEERRAIRESASRDLTLDAIPVMLMRDILVGRLLPDGAMIVYPANSTTTEPHPDFN